MIQEEELRKLAESDFGKTLVKWLDEKIKEMTDIDKINTQNTKDLIGKKYAKSILKELFSFLERAQKNEPETKKTDYL